MEKDTEISIRNTLRPNVFLCFHDHGRVQCWQCLISFCRAKAPLISLSPNIDAVIAGVQRCVGHRQCLTQRRHANHINFPFSVAGRIKYIVHEENGVLLFASISVMVSYFCAARSSSITTKEISKYAGWRWKSIGSGLRLLMLFSVVQRQPSSAVPAFSA